MAKVWTSLGVAAVVVVAAGLAQTSPGHALMRDMGLSKSPPGYTQLYFAHPRALPAALTSPAAVTAPFVIRNTSSAGHTYQWSASVVSGQQTRELASGSVQVQAGAAATVTRTVTFSCGAGRVRVEIGLASPRESLGFWAVCQPGTSPSPKASKAAK